MEWLNKKRMAKQQFPLLAMLLCDELYDLYAELCTAVAANDEMRVFALRRTIIDYLAEKQEAFLRHACRDIDTAQIKAGATGKPVRLHPNVMQRAVTDFAEWPE